MACANHPQTLSIDKCSHCGIDLCSDCLVVIEGKTFCPNCSNYAKDTHKSTKQRNPVVAAALTMFIPGLGQVYNGQLGKGLIITLTSWLLLPWGYGILDAYLTARRIDRGEIKTRPFENIIEALIVFFMLLIGPTSLYFSLRYVFF